MCKVHSFPTSPNLHRHSTVVNADVPNLHVFKTKSIIYYAVKKLHSLGIISAKKGFFDLVHLCFSSAQSQNYR